MACNGLRAKPAKALGGTDMIPTRRICAYQHDRHTQTISDRFKGVASKYLNRYIG